MKILQYLVFIGIFVMLSGITAYAHAIDDGSEANYISILKKQTKDDDGGSTADPGDTADSGDEVVLNVLNGTVDIKPETINLKRHGIFAAIIHLPETTDVELIDTKSIQLSLAPPVTTVADEVANAIGDFAPETSTPFTLMTTVAPTRVFVVEASNSAIALFPNQGIIDLVKNNIDISTLPAMITFDVQWMLTIDNTTIYEATDEVRVINPGNGNGKGNGKGKGKGGGAEQDQNKTILR